MWQVLLLTEIAIEVLEVWDHGQPRSELCQAILDTFHQR